MTGESTAEMPMSDPLLMDVGNIQPVMKVESDASVADYDAETIEAILTASEVKDAATIAAALFAEVDDARCWETMELADLKDVTHVPRVKAALIRKAMVLGLAEMGLIRSSCVEGVLGKAPSSKWAELLTKATDAPPCPSGDPSRAFVPTRKGWQGWMRELAAWLRVLAPELGEVVIGILGNYATLEAGWLQQIGVEGSQVLFTVAVTKYHMPEEVKRMVSSSVLDAACGVQLLQGLTMQVLTYTNRSVYLQCGEALYPPQPTLPHKLWLAVEGYRQLLAELEAQQAPANRFVVVGALTHMVQKLPAVRKLVEEKDQLYGVALNHEGLLDLLEREGRRLLTGWLMEQKASGGKAFGAVGAEECLAHLFLGGCNRKGCGGYHGEDVRGCLLKAFGSYQGNAVCWAMARTGKCAAGAACKWGHTCDSACRTHGKSHTHPAPHPQPQR